VRLSPLALVVVLIRELIDVRAVETTRVPPGVGIVLEAEKRILVDGASAFYEYPGWSRRFGTRLLTALREPPKPQM
jgi:hypothetical protein